MPMTGEPMLRASALASSMTRLALGVMAGAPRCARPPPAHQLLHHAAHGLRLAPYSWRMRAAVPLAHQAQEEVLRADHGVA